MIVYSYILADEVTHAITLCNMPAIMYESEDLCENDSERRIRDVVSWLNNQEALYHLEFENSRSYQVFDDRSVFRSELRETYTRWTRLTVYDSATAALLQIVFDGFDDPKKSIINWTEADQQVEKAAREAVVVAEAALASQPLADKEAANKAKAGPADPVLDEPLLVRLIKKLRNR